MAAYRSGDLDGAIDRLREGIAIDPLSFQLHYHLGLLQGRRDDTFEAIHQLETAVDLQPKNFSALKNLAVLYQRAGFKHKAIELWERALGSAPDEDTRRSIKDHLMSLLCPGSRDQSPTRDEGVTKDTHQPGVGRAADVLYSPPGGPPGGSPSP